MRSAPEHEDRPTDEAEPARPCVQRRTIGPVRPTPSGTWMNSPTVANALATWPKASSAGSDAPPSMSAG